MLTLGDDTVRIPLPEGWRVLEATRFGANVEVPWQADAPVSITLTPFKDEEAVRHSAPGAYFAPDWGKVFPPEEYGEEMWVQYVHKSGDTGQLGAGLVKIDLLPPDRIRRLAFHLPLQDDGRADSAEALADMRRQQTSNFFTEIPKLVLPSLEFSRELDRFDRIALGPDEILVHCWDVIHMPMLANWTQETENEDGSGLYVFEDKEDEDCGTFWVGYDTFTAEDAAETRKLYPDLVDDQKKLFVGQGFQNLSERRLADGDTLLTGSQPTEENGEDLEHLLALRLVRQRHHICLVPFHFYRPVTRIGEPYCEKVTAFLGKAIERAWITPIPA